jgi:hypothetical protein
MMVLSRRTQKLLAWWLVLTMTSMLVNIYAQGPAPDCLQYTDDPCTTTCIGCTYMSATDTFRERCCCRSDWGCWFNPFAYNSQVSRCLRRVYYCIVEVRNPTPPPDYIRHSYPCCAEPLDRASSGYCYEVNGAPCCDPGNSTAPCY